MSQTHRLEYEPEPLCFSPAVPHVNAVTVSPAGLLRVKDAFSATAVNVLGGQVFTSVNWQSSQAKVIA